MNNLPELPMRKFGKNGPELPLLGMGGSAMVDQFKIAYGVDLPTVEQRVSMVREAFDQGIRFFDTARAYVESESIMGMALKEVRDEAFIATKVIVHDPAEVRSSIETSLDELDTDYIDLIQIHGPAIEEIGVKVSMQIHEELVKLKAENICRMIGVTTHVGFREVYEMISTGGFDHVMLAYGYFNKGMDTMLSAGNLEFRELCLSKADELGMAIVAMKVLGGWMLGHNGQNLLPEFDNEKMMEVPGAAIRWAFQDERISLFNIGVSIPSDIGKNIRTFTSDLTYSAEDRLLLAEYCSQLYATEQVTQMAVV
jgi:predicted aldo/keto reductase-like oxidoreductase